MKNLKYFQSFVLFFVVVFTVNAKNLDSLWNIWHSKSTHDSLKVEAMSSIAWKILFTNLDSGFNLAQSQIELAIQSKSYKWEAQGYNIQGISFAIRGEFDKALIYFEKCLAIKINMKDSVGIAATTNNIAMLYENMGNYPKALEKHYESLFMKEKLKDSLGLANGYGNIAIVYDNIKDYEKAYEFYLKSAEVAIKIRNKKIQATVFHDMGINLKERGFVDSSLVMFYKSKVLFEELGIDNAQLYMNLGVIMMDKKNFVNAEIYLKRGYEISEKTQDMFNISAVLGNLCLFYNLTNNNKEAIKYGEKGYLIASEIGAIKQVSDNANFLRKAYRDIGNFEKSLYYFEKFVEANDSLTNEKKSKDIARHEVKYEFEKTQLIKEQQLKEQERKDREERERRDNLQYSLIFLGILLIFGLVLGSGKINISPKFAEGLIFFAFLIFFEFCLVLLDPYIDGWSNGEPIYKLIFNAVLAGLIFPLHSFFEKIIKRKVISKK
jgi:tetratricopeptide (TPR) repeat protein